MHGGYARPPCGVTLTGSVRAHVLHAPFIPGAQSLRELSVRRVQSQGDPPAAVSRQRGCGICPKNKVPRLIAYSLVLISLCSRPSSLFLNGSALRRACSSGFQPHRSQKSGASFAYWQAFPPFGRPHPACGLLSFFLPACLNLLYVDSKF